MCICVDVSIVLLKLWKFTDYFMLWFVSDPELGTDQEQNGNPQSLERHDKCENEVEDLDQSPAPFSSQAPRTAVIPGNLSEPCNSSHMEIHSTGKDDRTKQMSVVHEKDDVESDHTECSAWLNSSDSAHQQGSRYQPNDSERAENAERQRLLSSESGLDINEFNDDQDDLEYEL